MNGNINGDIVNCRLHPGLENTQISTQNSSNSGVANTRAKNYFNGDTLR